jgi:hypothetical protein
VQLGKDRGEIPRGVVPLGGPDPVPHLKERRRRHPVQVSIAGSREAAVTSGSGSGDVAVRSASRICA